ncbi:REST corepressor 2-like [Pseudophryne corroboree]|uniref:REST corepressor 2-like n=1 Tax=Pseudophryne corroboree TaxID=495146 RepID=UPI003081B2EB
MGKNKRKRKRSVSDVADNMIRVGPEFQAEIPVCKQQDTETQDMGDILLWAPSSSVSDAELEEYISLAQKYHGYSEEQALGMLQWHNYDLKRATEDLLYFTPVQDGQGRQRSNKR